jgi:hypothetical protein
MVCILRAPSNETRRAINDFNNHMRKYRVTLNLTVFFTSSSPKKYILLEAIYPGGNAVNVAELLVPGKILKEFHLGGSLLIRPNPGCP